MARSAGAIDLFLNIIVVAYAFTKALAYIDGDFDYTLKYLFYIQSLFESGMYPRSEKLQKAPGEPFVAEIVSRKQIVRSIRAYIRCNSAGNELFAKCCPQKCTGKEVEQVSAQEYALPACRFCAADTCMP